MRGKFLKLTPPTHTHNTTTTEFFLSVFGEAGTHTCDWRTDGGMDGRVDGWTAALYGRRLVGGSFSSLLAAEGPRVRQRAPTPEIWGDGGPAAVARLSVQRGVSLDEQMSPILHWLTFCSSHVSSFLDVSNLLSHLLL